MTRKRYRKLTRYAVLATLYGVILAAAWAGLVPEWAWLPLAIIWLFFVWAFGQYQADLAVNPALDEAAVRRWRIGFWFMPYSITAYWLVHIRRRRVFD